MLGAIGLTIGHAQKLRAQETRGQHVPWLDEIQRPPGKIPQNAPRLQSLVQRSGNELVDSVAKWEMRRKRFREAWLEFLGPLTRAKRTLPQVEIVKEDRPGTVIRQLVRYKVEKDQLVELALVAPRAFLLVGGESADGDRSWPFIEAALPINRLYNKETERARLGHFNHRTGHEVPEEAERRIYEWLTTYLGPP